MSETLEAWPCCWIPQQRRRSVSTSALFGFALKKTPCRTFFGLFSGSNFWSRNLEHFQIGMKWFSLPSAYVANLFTELKMSPFYSLDIKHNLCCGSTSVVQFMFWKHVFAYSINIHLSVIIQHTWYFCSSSEHSSVDNQMWLMKEKSHRKGAFSHCICLNAEGIFLCVGERADVLCIIFDYVAIACIWL